MAKRYLRGRKKTEKFGPRKSWHEIDLWKKDSITLKNVALKMEIIYSYVRRHGELASCIWLLSKSQSVVALEKLALHSNYDRSRMKRYAFSLLSSRNSFEELQFLFTKSHYPITFSWNEYKSWQLTINNL